MKVTKLRATNFKGRTFEHDLAPITIFTGPNGAGKSARLEALQLALAGFVPGLSSKPGDIAEAFGGTSDMAVGIRLENIEFPDALGNMGRPVGSFGVIRSYMRKPRGGVEYLAKYDGLPADWDVSPVAVDPTKFTGLSGPAQTRYLFQMARLTRKVNAQTVTALIKNIKLEENTEATEKIVIKLCLHAEVDWGMSKKSETTTQEYLCGFREYLREKYKAAKGNVERMNLTVQGITELRSKQPPSESSIQDVDRKLAASRAEETRLTTILGQIEAQLKHAEQQKTALARIDEQLAGELADCTIHRDNARSKHDELVAKHGQKPDVEALKSRQNDLVRTVKVLKQEVDAIEHRIEVANRDHHAKMAHTTCPFCKSKKQGWKDELVKEHEKLLTDLLTQRSAKESQRTPLLAEYTDLKSKIEAIDAQLTTWLAEENSIIMWRKELEDRNTLLARRADALKRKYEMSPADVGQLNWEKTSTNEKLLIARNDRSALDADKIRLSSERTEALQKIQAAKQAGETMAEAEVLKKALESVEELCETLVNESIGPVVTRLNDLCSPIMPAPIEFRDGAIGWRENGAWIGRSVQYGGARGALLAVGLSIALSEPGGIVMIHEFSNFSAENKQKLLHHFVKLINTGAIGQVVLADPNKVEIMGLPADMLSIISVK